MMLVEKETWKMRSSRELNTRGSPRKVFTHFLGLRGALIYLWFVTTDTPLFRGTPRRQNRRHAWVRQQLFSMNSFLQRLLSFFTWGLEGASLTRTLCKCVVFYSSTTKQGAVALCYQFLVISPSAVTRLCVFTHQQTF